MDLGAAPARPRRPGRVGAFRPRDRRTPMPRPTRPWRCGAALALAAAVALAGLGDAPPARADLLFLKDGTVLQGRVKRESKVDFDPSTREPFRIPQGFFL